MKAGATRLREQLFLRGMTAEGVGDTYILCEQALARSVASSRACHLCRNELCVHAAAGQELLVCALLDHLSLLQYQYVVHVANGRQSVGYYDRGSALHEAVEGVSDSRLADGVEVGSGLVEDQHRRGS